MSDFIAQCIIVIGLGGFAAIMAHAAYELIRDYWRLWRSGK